MKRGGQASMEFLLVLGIALLMTLPLIFIFYSQSKNISDDISSGQVDKVASQLRDAVDEVYYLGPPSKKTIRAFLPRGVENVTFSGSKIIFYIPAQGMLSELVKWTSANISQASFVSNHEGIHNIVVEAQEYTVLITDY